MTLAGIKENRVSLKTNDQSAKVTDLGADPLTATHHPEPRNDASETTFDHRLGYDAELARSEMWEEYARTLPEEAVDWRRGAIYVRERGDPSDTRSAAMAQLRMVLNLMTAKSVYVTKENVRFDSSGRGAREVRTFHELLKRGLDGRFVVLGVYSLNRICRNMVEAAAIKHQLGTNGIELLIVRR
jgi:hypothetical protein